MILTALLSLGFPKPPDYSVLSRRLASLKSDEAAVTCLLLDSMLPRQRAEVQFLPPVATVLRAVQRAPAERTLVVLGMDRRRGAILRRGVEARIESMSPYRASQGFYSAHSLTQQSATTAFDTMLVGGRRCEVAEGSCAWPPREPIFDARVRWLPELVDCGECEGGGEGEGGEGEGGGGCSAVTLTSAAALGPLVAEWQALVLSGRRERASGQLTRILSDLGPMPDAEAADGRAFWSAALANPLPALGVCREIRPALLQADDTAARVELVRAALAESIDKMRAMPPGPFEVEPPPGIRG